MASNLTSMHPVSCRAPFRAARWKLVYKLLAATSVTSVVEDFNATHNYARLPEFFEQLSRMCTAVVLLSCVQIVRLLLVS